MEPHNIATLARKAKERGIPFIVYTDDKRMKDELTRTGYNVRLKPTELDALANDVVTHFRKT